MTVSTLPQSQNVAELPSCQTIRYKGSLYAGLSDWSLLTTYGKLCILIFSAWGGKDGGIVAGLCVCTIMQTIVGCCADLMQDFKTSHLVILQASRVSSFY